MKSFSEFWPFYLGEHAKPGTRTLHFIGSSLGIVLAVTGIATGRWFLLLGALLCGYAFAWIGHFGIEKNRPATFKYPLWSFAGDWKMWWLTVTGRLPRELQRLNIQPK